MLPFVRRLLRRLSSFRPAELPACFSRSQPSAVAARPEPAARVLALFQQALQEGHTCLPRSAFAEQDTPVLVALAKQGSICQFENGIALTECAVAESQIAAGLARTGTRLRPIAGRHFQAPPAADEAGKLTAEQRAAVRQLVQAKIGILTGAPGTGKTATIKALVAVLERAGYQIALTAPTGRAAIRLQEATGKPARTLHRLLRTRRVRRSKLWNWCFPAPKETIIVDEASMLDVFLMARLVAVCTPRTKLILVGDVDQLPSVGPGQVLRDLLASGCVPVSELTTNFRQSANSQIITAAAAIRAGKIPDLPAPGAALSDCYFLAANTASQAAALIVKAVTRSLPARCGADPYQSIQVLTPKRRGTLGTELLNAMLQDALNEPSLSPLAPSFPPLGAPSVAPLPFAVGDRVLHTKNNYALGVFNGECGSVCAVTENGAAVTVQYGQRLVRYTEFTLPQLTHGFAITIHRAQGSEYPFVVIPVHETQQPMLSRALLYTALTRARKMAIFVGSRAAFAQALANDEASKRQTGLQQCLRRALPPVARAITVSDKSGR